MKYANRKVLIISHNPLSAVNNNGKTLVSIFEGVPNENIYQIYLNSDIPDYSDECHYLQLNEKQIIGSFFKAKNICCQEIHATPGEVSSTSIKKRSFANHTKRLVREGVWKITIWKTKLKKWLAGKRFDVVFFMAGDGLFAYDIYRFVMKHISAKGCVFFTDDYIIGRVSRSPVAYLRQYLLKRKIRKTLPAIKELYVISEEMKEAYYDLWKVEGYVVRNFSIEKKEAQFKKRLGDLSNHFSIVYAGGLHYSRWKVLAQIADSLKKLNQINERKCSLYVYSSQNISSEIIDSINLDGASKFCGGVSAAQIADVYAEADILLHVESFEKKAIASTKYSFSTKIPEYLSAEKCVLAVGPEEVASIKYLKDFACVVSDDVNLSTTLNKIINDAEYREQIKNACKERYKKDFSKQKQKECLEQILSIN